MVIETLFYSILTTLNQMILYIRMVVNQFSSSRKLLRCGFKQINQCWVITTWVIHIFLFFCNDTNQLLSHDNCTYAVTMVFNWEESWVGFLVISVGFLCLVVGS